MPCQPAFPTADGEGNENNSAPVNFPTAPMDRSKIFVSMERRGHFDQRLRTFRVTLSILVSGCITLGAVVWWRLLN
ncbi:hypothetical protein Rcae01_05774 [Novipirellula caenicola]|uniref:Uncharacterized protein n=1 Tax=Novipirellula caenicola TaxID=1536901 RepID=A0ABP9VYR2_9BACT